jgi:hypothetical protein
MRLSTVNTKGWVGYQSNDLFWWSRPPIGVGGWAGAS